jgi:hypothetical protein
MKWQFSGRKTLLLLVTLFIGRLFAVAQQNHFMYIQSDSKEPFNVTLNKKNFSSSNSGYLIISQIASGQYTFTVGFPQNKYPEQTFTCTIDNKDVGYGLKNLGDKGWALVNLQTMEMILAGSNSSGQTQPAAAANQTAAVQPTTPAAPATDKTNAAATTKKESGLFGDMLSQVVGDPSIKAGTAAPAPAVKNNAPVQQPATVQQQPQPVAVQQAPARTSTAAEDKDTEEERPVSNTRGVIKTREEARKEGRNVTFIDFNAAGGDTVKIFIPQPGTENTAATAQDKKRKTLFDGDPAPGNGDGKTVNNPFYNKAASQDASTAQPANSTASVVTDTAPAAVSSSNKTPGTTARKSNPVEPLMQGETEWEKNNNNTGAPVKTASYNSNCSGMATDNDLAKLRKRMVGAGADDRMIEVARKAFKSKCYTTDQIKNLGMLFYTDENRYKFFDAGYPFVYDVKNYASLESLLIDDYYKKRFRAMLRL